MVPFKKLLSKLEIPNNDWVLSRLGGCEPPSVEPAAEPEETSADEEAPASQAPISVAARLFNRWFDPVSADEVTVPPQSEARVSPNVSDEEAAELSEQDSKSRAC